MLKVYQTKYGLEDGNCFEACVSTLTGIPLDKIPYFDSGGYWINNFFNWAREKGYKVIHIKDPLNGNFALSEPVYAIGRDGTHAFILKCYTALEKSTNRSYFELRHDPICRCVDDSDVDVKNIISIFILEKLSG